MTERTRRVVKCTCEQKLCLITTIRSIGELQSRDSFVERGTQKSLPTRFYTSSSLFKKYSVLLSCEVCKPFVLNTETSMKNPFRKHWPSSACYAREQPRVLRVVSLRFPAVASPATFRASSIFLTEHGGVNVPPSR